MKKIFTTCLLALLSAVFVSITAQITVRLNIDDPNRITVSVNDIEKTDLVTGLNEFDVPQRTYIKIASRPGYTLLSVTETNGDYEYAMPIHAEDGTQICEFTLYGDYGDTYVIKSEAADNNRTAHCTLRIDDPSKVKIVRLSDDSVIDITNDEMILDFNPATESQLKITPVNKPLYSVSINDTPVISDGYGYTLTIADGDIVEIKANYPDIDCPVHFVLSGDEAEYFIQGVDVDGRPVFNYLDNSFSVKAGAEIKIYGNTTEWQVDAFTINEEPAAFFNPYTFIVTEETTVDIAVHQYASFTMTINIDNPENIIVYKGYSYNGDIIELTTGANVVRLLRTTPIVSLVPAEGHYLKSVVVDGYAYEDYELKVAPVLVGSLTDNSILTIESDVINRNKKAVVYINDLTGVEEYFKMLRADRSLLTDLTSGYNHIEFYDGDNAFEVQTGSPLPANVYLNDQPVEPKSPESPNYNVTIADKDVVKVFFGSQPDIFEVSFEIDADLIDHIALTRDQIATPDNWSTGFTTIDKTELSISSIEETTNIQVAVNGIILPESETDSYTFTVIENSLVTITADTSGVEQITATRNDSNNAVYNLNGIIVAPDKTSAQFAKLPKGIYIYNGNKLIKQ